MNKKLKAEIRQRLNSLKELENPDYLLYQSLLNTKKELAFVKEVYNTLIIDTAYEYKHYAAAVLSQLDYEQVVPYLLKAAINPINKNYSAPFIWACSKYNCYKYLSKFIDIIYISPEPDEKVVACVNVIKAIKPPYKVDILKAMSLKLLKKKVTDPLMEMLIAHCCFILVDNYFTESDAVLKEI